MQLLASFIGVSSDYALARLELTYRHGEIAAPPTIDRLADASEETLRAQWDTVEEQLALAATYLKQNGSATSSNLRNDPGFAWLGRCVKEMDQYARAVRWVLTVTQREDAS